MMFIDVANNVASIVLFVVCYWLSSQNSLGREPLGRTIALGYATCAILLLCTVFAHTLHIPLAWLYLSIKSAFAFTLGLVAIRIFIIHGD